MSISESKHLRIADQRAPWTAHDSFLNVRTLKDGRGKFNTYILQALVAIQGLTFDGVGGLVLAVGQDPVQKHVLHQRHCKARRFKVSQQNGFETRGGSWLQVSHLCKKCLLDPPSPCLFCYPCVYWGCTGGWQPSAGCWSPSTAGRSHLWDSALLFVARFHSKKKKSVTVALTHVDSEVAGIDDDEPGVVV